MANSDEGDGRADSGFSLMEETNIEITQKITFLD